MKLNVNAHRGILATYPENTLISFEAAARLPVDAIEFDVHLSRDNHLVVVHDTTIDRCSNGQGRVNDFTLAELRQFDFGSWKGPQFAGARILTLEETVAAIHAINPALHLLIEVKDNNLDYAAALLDFVRQRKLLEQAMLSSFHFDVLSFLRQHEPNVKLHGNDVSQEGDPDGISTIVNSVGINRRVASRERVAYYKERGIRVDTWIINDAESLELALVNGTESITTDCADHLCRLLGRTAEMQA